MKKISLVAIAMIATTANAEIRSESFGGSASLFYGTNDANNGDLFDKGTSYGNTAVQLNGIALVGSCDTCVKLNYGITGVSTMGLENTLVGSTWVNHTNGLNDGVWIDTLNLTFSPLNDISNTTLVVGRQALTTPMVFTETWNIAKNTYDAIVAVNNDIEKTTLVAGWIGRSNIAGGSTVNVANIGDGFSSFLTSEGAYTVGAVTTLIPMVTAQAWYYVAPTLADATWIQAETEISGFTLGGQFGNWDPKVGDGGTGFAVKAGYGFESLGLSVAYSSVEKNAAFENLGGLQSPLYTEAWWNYGYVGKGNTDTISASATYDIKDVADLGLYVTMADNGTSNTTMQEVTVTAGKSIGNLDMAVAYINSDYDVANQDAQNDIQVYFTYNF